MITRDSDYRKNRKIVLNNFRCCQSCGSKEDLEVHHIIPIMEGGTNDISNLKVLCHDCHCKTKLHNKAIKNGMMIGEQSYLLGKERMCSVDELYSYLFTMTLEDDTYVPNVHDILDFMDTHTRRTPKRIYELINMYPKTLQEWTRGTNCENMTLDEINQYAESVCIDL